ncbi:uncharacterized protein LAJ45_09606 [Morchella importuna]|uniref:uncharacterized protein n=1 Tax=Morchella importuna TaxID=1174673 RepID=UPI001E8E47A1|nr:uncharacterized protein LAJ45_09606 [Morchella importuna]KAH8146413.1 hypothetical protein LAJ45_09606 [Morchella importuna]
MPPTPPPTIESNTEQHQQEQRLPDVNYPDARNLQPLPDSPTYPTTTTQPQKKNDDVENPRFDFPLPPRARATDTQQTLDTRQKIDCKAALVDNNDENNQVPLKKAPISITLPPQPHSLPPQISAAFTSVAATAVDIVNTATAVTEPSAKILPLSEQPSEVVEPPLEVGECKADEPEYDLELLKSTVYRRSGATAARGPLVHRGIGIVKRDRTALPGVKGESSRAGIAATSATPGSGRLKEDELAGRYAQPRSPPLSSQNPPTSSNAPPPPASPIHSHSQHSSDQSASEEEEEHSEEEEEEEEEEDDMEDEESWISGFCNMVGHEYFAEVSEEFIEDDFNLTGLGAMVPMYKEALEMILDVEPEDDSDSAASASESLSEQPGAPPTYRRRAGHMRVASDVSMIENSAELLYGLIHQRFITSRQGIQVMYEKYLSNHFGFCQRVFCNNARVLPCGYSDTPGVETVKLFCPSCCDIYVPPNSRFQTVDGAYFGTTFASLFLMTFPELDVSGNGRKEIISGSSLNSVGGRKGTSSANAPLINGVLASNLAPGLGKGKQYEMRIYGFRVSERARSGPRMGWLRAKPEQMSDLDETTRHTEATVDAGYSSDGEGPEESDGDEGSVGEDDINAV